MVSLVGYKGPAKSEKRSTRRGELARNPRLVRGRSSSRDRARERARAHTSKSSRAKPEQCGSSCCNSPMRVLSALKALYKKIGLFRLMCQDEAGNVGLDSAHVSRFQSSQHVQPTPHASVATIPLR